ncbi:hypothetical protein [Metabacillus halosaccharovorans]|uniref:hypothetical protein n=1 Tax=Metabacillus halosaccharovorans TaxID=930124 RepID=UPI0020420EF6|nr:hypothetical protein [Metabacillus halosaccharovorans]MCM3442966.1 hypothetical protein [Metabacillus halosaccharovorans]
MRDVYEVMEMTNEQIEKDIRKLDEMIRLEREARRLSAEPPEPFLSGPLRLFLRNESVRFVDL